MIRASWHRFWCRLIDAHLYRETRDGVLGYRCVCGHWEPVIQRSAGERAAITVPAAHARYRVWKTGAAPRVRVFRRGHHG